MSRFLWLESKPRPLTLIGGRKNSKKENCFKTKRVDIAQDKVVTQVLLPKGSYLYFKCRLSEFSCLPTKVSERNQDKTFENYYISII